MNNTYRILLYNAHRELWFGITFKFWIYRRPWVPKYRYIAKHALREQAGLFIVSDTPVTSSFWAKLADFVRFYLWLFINRYPLLKSRIYFSDKHIESTDILLIMYIGNFAAFGNSVNSDTLSSRLNKISCIKILNVNHFPYNIGHSSNQLSKFNFDAFWAEVSLFDCSPFFSMYFKSYIDKPFIVVPFAAKKKFHYLGMLASHREKKIFATGSISLDMSRDLDFCSFFGTTILQPMRKNIFDLQHESLLDSLFFSVVNPLDQNGSTRPVRDAKNLILGVKNWIHNVFFYGQRGYHDMDLNALFNTYAFHLVGEEIVGLPGISFAEGMMAGSILVGLDHPMYTSLGMIPWVHFIPYSPLDSPNQIAANLRDLLSDDKLLNYIQYKSLLFARSNFSELSAWSSMSKQLQFLLVKQSTF